MTRSPVRRAAVAAGTAVLLAAAATAGSAEDAPASTVTIGSITTSATQLRIATTASLAPLAATEVGTDAAGDSRVPGTDLVRASIEPLGGGRTAFELEIGNFAPGVGSLPAVTHHNWDFVVTQPDGTSTALGLKAIKGGAVIASALDGGSLDAPSFALQVCTTNEQTGQGECASEYIDGEYTDSGVRFLVSNARIGATSGSVITPGEDGINVSPGVSDVIWYTGGQAGDVMGAKTYTVPDGVVRVGLAPAGTDPATVQTATVKDAPGTSVRIDLPRPPAGSYVVVAEACHGGVCGPRVSRDVTVS